MRSPSSTGPIRTSPLLVPEQVIPLAQLAGTWNYVAYVDGENHGVLQPSNGVRVIDAAGKVVSGTECVGLICSPAESVISDLTVDAAGGFDIAGEGGAVARVFAFKTGEGAMSLYVLDPNEGGLTVLTKQVALVLPSVGKTSQNWDFTVGSGGFRWAPANNPQGSASALSDLVDCGDRGRCRRLRASAACGLPTSAPTASPSTARATACVRGRRARTCRQRS